MVITVPKRQSRRIFLIIMSEVAQVDDNFEKPYIVDSVERNADNVQVGAVNWKEASDSEIEHLRTNKTWQLVQLHKGRKTIGCRWVFRVKENQDGKIEPFKVRLVSKGFSQKFGIDYEETFAPVAKLNSIKLILSPASKYCLDAHQMDVRTALLNGELDEDIYMAQPDRYIDEHHEHLVCKLQRSQHGLNPLLRKWSKTIDDFMIKIGFKKC